MTPEHERLVEEGLAVVTRELDLMRLYLKRTVMGDETVGELDETTRRATEFINKVDAWYRSQAETDESSVDPLPR